MARIPQHFIDQLLERTDLVALVDARVPLKRSGREFAACCPFHDERTPSFTVSPTKQFYHCFGCGAHGSAISFLMEYDRLEFRDAVEILAEAAGLAMPADASDDDAPGPPREPLFEAMRWADRHYRGLLRRRSDVIDYLKNRGVSGEMAARYGLGYAPDAWDELARRMPDRAAAARAGLLIERDSGGWFDRFRNRLMFPIRDTRGRVVAFGGRTLGDDSAKYLNSPETPLFHKSDHVYGLYEARQTQRQLDRLLVVEGYMDVIALAQHDFPNAVATLGTATTAAHLTTLFRHTSEIVFCFDGDAAGRRAAARAMEHSLPVLRGTRRVRFLFLPEGEDPDSLVRGARGRERMADAIDNARSASSVLLDQLCEGLDLATPDGRAELVERARAPMNALPPEAFRAEMISELSRLSGLPADDLRAFYAAEPQRPAARPRAPDHTPADDPHQTRLPPVTRGLMLLLADPALAARAGATSALQDHPNPGATILAEAIDFFTQRPNCSVAQWLERYRDHRYFQRLQRLAAADPPGDAEQRAREFSDVVNWLRDDGRDRAQLRQRYNALVARQAQGPLDAASAQELKDVLNQLQGRSTASGETDP